jgi:hypothetical protein
MGFKVMVPNRAQDDGARVLIGIRTYGGGHKLVLSISEDTARALRWKDGDKIEVAAGTEEDAGKIQLRPGAQGYKLRTISKKTSRLGLKCVPWADCPDEYANVQPEISVNQAARTLIIFAPWHDWPAADEKAA